MRIFILNFCDKIILDIVTRQAVKQWPVGPEGPLLTPLFSLSYLFTSLTILPTNKGHCPNLLGTNPSTFQVGTHMRNFVMALVHDQRVLSIIFQSLGLGNVL